MLRSKHTSPVALTLAHCSTALCKVHSTNATGPNFSWALGYLPGGDAHPCHSRVPSSAEKLFSRGSWPGVWCGMTGKAQTAAVVAHQPPWCSRELSQARRSDGREAGSQVLPELPPVTRPFERKSESGSGRDLLPPPRLPLSGGPPWSRRRASQQGSHEFAFSLQSLILQGTR